MKILIGILTCHARRNMANVQRETWVKAARDLDIDVKFFVGAGEFYQSDEVCTSTLDDYDHMTDKARVCYELAFAGQYDYLFTCGDDTWIHPRRLLQLISECQEFDYVGHLRGEDGQYSDDYASGGPGTLYSRKALQCLVEAPATSDPAEDRWAGNTLRAAGFHLHRDNRLCLPAEWTDRKPWEIVSVETIRVGHKKVDMKKIHDLCFTRSNILVAIITCHKFFQQRALACQRTWVPEILGGADVRFFVGNSRLDCQPSELTPNTVILEVPDNYHSLPFKTQAAIRWAYLKGYEHVLKVDDDAIIAPERLLQSDFREHDYIGRLRGPSGNYPAPYASGLAYWLSRKAMKVIAKAQPPLDTAEDRWVGNTLLNAGIEGHPDYRYAIVTSQRNAVSAPEGPLQGNEIIVGGEYHGTNMDVAWKEWKDGKQAVKQSVNYVKGPLQNICVMVKTFLRDGLLDRTLMAIEKNLPEAKIIVVDDGQESRYKITKYAQLRARGHSCVWMPFDSGFGAKSNKALEFADRKYLLIASDDFNFGDTAVREGIIKLVDVLESDSLAIASGRVNSRPYEGTLELHEDSCREHEGYSSEVLKTPKGTEYRLCDLTVNFSLIRRDILGLDKIHWDSDVKIGGGEHGAFFIDVKRAGHKVCWVSGVNINEQPFSPLRVDPRYPKFRARAREDKSRPCFARRGIKSYIMFGGAEDINGN